MEPVVVALDAELKELGDIPIDDVLSIVDREVPSYRDLYYRWETQQWAAGAIDFSDDRMQWDKEISPELKRSLRWNLAAFHVGEEQATHGLVAYVDAAPTEEHQVFLATQLVDEARHTVFLDLFDSEVVNREATDMRARLDAATQRLTPSGRRLFLELLPSASARLRERPNDPDAFVAGIVLYHLLIEATLASTVRRFLLNFLRASELLPGFRQGFTASARDETRHVGFGLRYLGEAIGGEPGNQDLVRKQLDTMTPATLDVLQPPDGDVSYFDPLPYSAADLADYAVNTLTKRLRAIGLEA